MLELREVWKGAKSKGKQRWMLAGANLAVPAGRRVALLGTDAADIRTVLHVLAGVEHPDSGSVRRVGLPCWPFGSSKFIDVAGTLRQNANFLSYIYGVDGGDVAAIATELSGVKLRKGRPLKRYPLSERRQLALGLTLALQFDWYFINQRLPRVAKGRVAQIDGVIADRFSRAGVIWATTKPETVAGYCDAGLVLDQGALTFYDTLEAASEAYGKLTTGETSKRK
ncbi:hypothetical protein [Hansschlegelia sp.]|uniref:hypothetical protein n=1 Tax=Hansschlegelia sp. TaxID=2041892 RepID=UPI002CC884DD|nr:hypothetical protein [Hansschlegelia sp.]HVI28740.1 hypothetical protein [Hansschlegelia sp.]